MTSILARLFLLLALTAAASCSKLSASRIWVKRPGSKKLEIVDSLTTLCAKHELDEEEMLAVSRGEQDDYKGWECGEMECDEDEEEDGEAAAEAEADGDKAVDAAEDEAPATAAAPMPPTPKLGSKMIVGMLAPMAGTQLMKRFDQESPNFVLGLRGCFTACVAVHTLVDLLLAAKIAAANETGLVTEAPNPLSMLMGGGLGSAPKTTRQYDMAQLSSMRNSFRMGVVVVALLHWKFKWNQMLVYQGIQTIIELFYHPLVQVHLYGRPATDELSRPFGAKGGSPDMSALFKGLTQPDAAPAS